MTQPTATEKKRIRDAANAAIRRLHAHEPLTQEEDEAIDTYFDSDWHGEDFRELTAEEIQEMKRRFKPGALPWLDKYR